MVGYRLCERLMAVGAGDLFRLTVFGEEPRPAYDRIHLTQFFSGRDPESLLLAPREWYGANEITLHTGDPVVAIDRERRVVRSASGREVPYDRLVLATGSRAFVPPIEGAQLPGVFVYRTLEDLAAIRDYAAGRHTAAVLGGGLLGLEAAKALHDCRLETHIVESSSGLLARQLNPPASDLLLAAVLKLGLHVRLQRQTMGIDALGAQRVLHFNNGETLAVDLVVIAAGVRPRDELASACGLPLGIRGGVLVDDHLQTSDPDIFAIGECASHRGVIYGLAVPGYKMVDVLVDNLLGGHKTFPGADLSAKLKLLGVSVATLGDYQGQGDTVTHQTDAVYRQLVVRDRRVVGAIAIGDWPELGRVQEAIDSRRRLARSLLEDFSQTGTVWPEAGEQSVQHWPANAIVCNCMTVRRSVLGQAMARGCTTVESLARCTGASTVCGSCKPLLAELVGAPVVVTAAKGWRPLLAASAFALLAALAIAWFKPLPVAGSVQGGWQLADFWHDGFLKQVTGWTLFGLCVVSLLLSLRKRLRWFTLGDFGWWRAAHGVVGVLTLLALISHTGFRLGHHLNFVLMTNFLALALLGALAGGVTALEAKLTGAAARRLRAVWTGAHTVLFWPLPALVLFHMLAVYRF